MVEPAAKQDICRLTLDNYDLDDWKPTQTTFTGVFHAKRTIKVSVYLF